MEDKQIFLLILLLVALLVIFSSCSLKCGSNSETYLSLPFAGGDVRSYQPDPKMIEGPLWRAMDSADMNEGVGDYPR